MEALKHAGSRGWNGGGKCVCGRSERERKGPVLAPVEGGWELRLTWTASALPLPKIHQDIRPTTWNTTRYRQVQKKQEIQIPNTPQMMLKALTPWRKVPLKEPFSLACLIFHSTLHKTTDVFNFRHQLQTSQNGGCTDSQSIRLILSKPDSLWSIGTLRLLCDNRLFSVMTATGRKYP